MEYNTVDGNGAEDLENLQWDPLGSGGDQHRTSVTYVCCSRMGSIDQNGFPLKNTVQTQMQAFPMKRLVFAALVS